MSATNKIVTLTDATDNDIKLYPRTKLGAISDENNNTLDFLLNAKQDTLVSGTNIKTINSTSLLGSGNIDILSTVYPVGSIYMSVSSTNPGSLFGGTWEQIKDTFLLSAGDTYTAGDTGGNSKYTPAGTVGDTTLDVNKIPAHNHTISVNTAGNPDGWNDYGRNYWNNNWGSSNPGTANKGGGQSHNHTFTGTEATILPPYLVVYVWKRTA